MQTELTIDDVTDDLPILDLMKIWKKERKKIDFETFKKVNDKFKESGW